MRLEGTYTALITPFDERGRVDEARLLEHVERQIEAGVDGLVPVGTTGESPTLTVEEHNAVVSAVVRAAGGRVPVIAGTGANSTQEALALTRHAIDAGADATLQVTPYYNKPNQAGLIRHFTAVADLGLPTVLYNVPGRTGREIAVSTVVELAGHPGIAALKEAGGSVDRVSAILNRCDLTGLSGDDSLPFPMMAVGARGIISVASNVAPSQVADLTRAALGGEWERARALHHQLYPLFTELFCDTNPIPVKAALAMMGQIEEVYRLPLCEMDDALKAGLRRVLEDLGVL
jgi:4-hydroxy-tetrahydrodipicolinate synthase